MAISFRGAHFPKDIILMGVRWYVAYPLSTRHVEELMLKRGVHVDHSTINRWVVKYSPQLEEAFHRRKRPVWVSWRMDIRQRVAAVGRRVNTLCRGEEGLLAQLVLFQTYHNFVLPHASLRQPLPVAEATNGGSAKVWRPCTPAMAAGLTDHVWSLKEVLCYRVPPWPQPQTV